MSKSVAPSDVRKRLSKELLNLYHVLSEQRTDVISDASPLSSAANQVIRTSKGNRWEYEIAELTLQVKMPQKSLPTSCGEWLNITIDLDIAGACLPDGSAEIDKLVLNLRIETATKGNVCSWHFDRHISGDDPTEDVLTEAHPRYHFQHGGHAMEPFADNLGGMLLLPAPRLAFPPMNAILSLDFVLSNFSGQCWQQLRDEPTYVRLLKDSQHAYWRPYIEKIASWWDKAPKKDTECQDLWPHLI